jgi:hypothetical protein
MNKKLWVLLIASYLVVLMVDAPASLLSNLFFQLSQGRIELANTQGTIWRGVANPVFHQRKGASITLQKLHWEFATLKLLTGKISANFYWEDQPQAQPMAITFAANKLELQYVYIPLPATLLTNISDFLKPAQLRGQLILKSDVLIWTATGWQGTATADWLNASSLICQVAPLGNYHLNFSATNSGLNFDLNTVSGALLLNGSGRYSMTGAFNLNATAKAEAGNEVALNELLNHLGPEQSGGVHTFNLVQ